MKKIVILGCENSHANVFLDFIKGNEKYADVEVVGVYSHEEEPMKKLNEKYGVKIMSSYDEAVDEVDGIIVVARHGDNHYKYAAPYIKKGIPMFIDKPITVSEEEAVKFMQECKDNGVRITGGSCCIHDVDVLALRHEIEEQANGEVLGGFVSAPINMKNDFGGYFFYAQHIVAIMQTIFGLRPNSVKAAKNGKHFTATYSYDNFDVSALHTEGCYKYHATVVAQNGISSKNPDIVFANPCFLEEFDHYYSLLCGGEQTVSYSDFITAVHILNATYRALESGKEEKITYAEI